MTHVAHGADLKLKLKLFNKEGDFLSVEQLKLKIIVTSIDSKCVLYSERINDSLGRLQSYLIVKVGYGIQEYPSNTVELADIFENSKKHSCMQGNTFAGQKNEKRKVIVQYSVSDKNEWKTLEPQIVSYEQKTYHIEKAQ